MQLYQYRKTGFEFGFIILSPNHNFGRLKSTTQSIKNHFPEVESICVTYDSAPTTEIKEMKKYCPVYKGGDSMATLINAGMKKGHKQWNILLNEGVFVNKNLNKKYTCFLESEKEVLYPITLGKMSFDESPINGTLIHQSTFLEIGDFLNESLELSKLVWAANAESLGIKFKGILGMKVC